MKLQNLVLASVLAIGASPALAQDCDAWLDEIAGILNEGAEASMSTSSGGQAVAAARETQAQEVEDVDELDPVPVQDPAREQEAVEDAKQAGSGGDRIQQAIAKLEAARADLGEDSAGACEEAVADVIRALVLPDAG